MAFYAYEGIPDQVLDKQHTTSTGEQYTLRHNEALKVEMTYLGKGDPHANSQGWERDSGKYFKTLYQNHPEMFSKKNVARIQEGHAPIVDQKMIAQNSSWAQYANQPLVHHHIGGDGEAVAVPKNMHKGRGEIHNQERDAGITDNCKNFSKQCSSQKDVVGKTVSQLYATVGQQAANSQKQATNTQKQAANPQTAKQSAARKDAVRNADRSSQTAKQGNRAAQVRNAVSGSQKGGQRCGAVRAASGGQSTGVSHGGRTASVGGQSAGVVGGRSAGATGGGHSASGGQGR